MAEGWLTNPLVKQFRRGGLPRDIRLMAAQGLLPLKPEDLLELWTALASDADEGVRGAAEASLMAFPAVELLPVLQRRETPVAVLAWAASHRFELELRESALGNPSLPDETIEALAPTLPQALAELVVVNQTRLLRSGALLSAIESNPGLSNDQKRRLRELRETFRIGEERKAPAATRQEPEAQAADQELDLVPPGEIFMTESEALVRYLSEEDRMQPEKVSAVQKIHRLNTAERIITALKGSRDERAILIRDPNRLVAFAVLGSPRITEAEIESISAMKDVSGEILRAIDRHRHGRDRPSPGFSPEERELLVRLSGLFISLNRSFGAVKGRLTGEQCEEIELAFDRARAALREGVLNELRACLRDMQSVSRLLEE